MKYKYKIILERIDRNLQKFNICEYFQKLGNIIDVSEIYGQYRKFKILLESEENLKEKRFNFPRNFGDRLITKIFFEMKDFLIDSFFDEEGIFEWLISPDGYGNVDNLASILAKSGMKNNQLRKFYDEIVKIYENFRKNGNIETAKQKLFILLALSEYSKEASEEFKEIFRNRIDIITKSQDENFSKNLEMFYQHMLSLVGYFSKYKRD